MCRQRKDKPDGKLNKKQQTDECLKKRSLLLWNWLSWHYKLTARSASHLQPIHLLEQYFSQLHSGQSKDLSAVEIRCSSQPGYFHQISVRLPPNWVCVCGTGLALGQLTPFTKASASDKQRMTCILKHRFQNRKVQAILIPCSFCSSEFLAVSQSTTHWAHIFSSYNWNWDGKQVAG